MRAKCVMCMIREGHASNGGLCYVCAPRPRAVLRPRPEISIKVWHVSLDGARADRDEAT